MTQSDRELIERLRAVDHMSVEECFIDSFLFAKAADLLESQAAEIERLREDKARLDFLDACARRLNEHYGTDYGWRLILNHNVTRLMAGNLAIDLNDTVPDRDRARTCRTAIDARRQALKGTGADHG